MRILLIEPDRILADTYARFLEVEGYTVHVAHTAGNAINAADALKPDMIILELQLVGHSGVAFLQEFRSYEDWLYIPGLVHSVLPPQRLEQYAESFKQLGVVGQLYKPQTSLVQLGRTVERCRAMQAT